MGRPTVYGKEIRLDRHGKCVGINLGYNFYSEHEGDTIVIVDSANRKMHSALSMLKAFGAFAYRKQISQLSKKIKANEKALARWSATPFNGHVFAPTTNSMLKMIVINNSEVRNKYSNVMLNDGHYYILSIGDGLTPEYWEKKFGSKKTVSEEDLFYMPDYQNMIRSTGYILNQGHRLKQDTTFGASWALGSEYMIIVLPAEQKSYLEDLQSALNAGNLACVSQEPRMFSDRGCCLIDLQGAYLPR